MSEEKKNDALGGANDESPKKELLIVDDDESYLKLIKKWMSETYKAIAVKSGSQALKYLEGHKPDLVLLDYEMPVTPGPKVLEMFKSDMSIKDIPVMFLTSKGDKASIVRVLALKPTDYILKTIDKTSLHLKIDNFFRMR